MSAGEATLRTVFAGRRGRLLVGLLLAEFAAAIQSVAYSTVLPIASRELGGSGLYGATLASGSLSTILVLAAGPGTFSRLGARRTLFLATGLNVGGVVVAATAPAMALVLAGSVMRGLAAGLLAGFGLIAIGGLYEDVLRARVLGLFAVMWLLPSLAGPVLNAAVAVSFGWRWAMAWPAAVVLVARLLVGRDAGIIPWRSEAHRLDLVNAALVVGGLVVASIASLVGAWWAVPLFAFGVLLAVVASARILHDLVRGQARRFRTALSLLGLCLAFFGGSGLIALAVVEGLQRGVVASSIAFGAGLVAWSLTGLRLVGPRLRDASTIGLGLLAVALAVEGVALTHVGAPTPALVLVVGGWAAAGLGMGLSYPRLSAQAFDALPPQRVASVATAVAFAETSGTAAGALLGGGVYSLSSSFGIAASTSISWAFWLLAAAAATAGMFSWRR